MANYKELEGFSVQTLATDPDTPGWVGSIFYNSTSGTFKVVKAGGVTAGTWASGGTSWQAVKTTGFTGAAGEGYFCDTTSAAFTLVYVDATQGWLLKNK